MRLDDWNTIHWLLVSGGDSFNQPIPTRGVRDRRLRAQTRERKLLRRQNRSWGEATQRARKGAWRRMDKDAQAEKDTRLL